jgi:hypothetical protein
VQALATAIAARLGITATVDETLAAYGAGPTSILPMCHGFVLGFDMYRGHETKGCPEQIARAATLAPRARRSITTYNGTQRQVQRVRTQRAVRGAAHAASGHMTVTRARRADLSLERSACHVE